jgi:hypothetical protein
VGRKKRKPEGFKLRRKARRGKSEWKKLGQVQIEPVVFISP